ncbi:hypothetical protein NA57DRAFT_50251 [Rhizodiscina lignyota]|uniref:GH64 domain-containing protein n=1 Tax=Rhizodiscina lignyota TaxID=1504668 RepID=A0A9P4I2L3_9PEZI|nr:hypothetical protein NA57DRAFT_50251 [Rhizodiscina lignyota]
MRGLTTLALGAVGCLIGRSLAVPTPVVIVTPGDASDVVISSNNTVNATAPAPSTPPSTKSHTIVTPRDTADTVITARNVLNATTSGSAADANLVGRSTGQLPLSLVNNFAGSINAYVTGLDVNGRLVMLQPDGTFLYPSCDSAQSTPQLITDNIAIPLGAKGSTLNITIPGYISAARVWFAAGDLKFFAVWNPATNAPSLVEPSSVNPSDPSAAVNWGFVELTYVENGGLYANISYVDFVGLILGMSLAVTDGSGTQSALGLAADAISNICSALESQGKSDGQEWGNLCMADSEGNLLRVIAPSDYVSSNPDAFSTFWNEYIDDVWEQFTTDVLSIDTQMSAGIVNCTVQTDDLLHCDGDSRGYAKPVAADIFGCNTGPFGIEAGDNDVHSAVVPRLCAAFDRTTLSMEGGNIQPSLAAQSYYQSAPTNWYSKFVHQHEVDGKGYAFSYDDVNPDGDVNQSGVVASANPETLTVIVGGPLS